MQDFVSCDSLTDAADARGARGASYCQALTDGEVCQLQGGLLCFALLWSGSGEREPLSNIGTLFLFFDILNRTWIDT